MIVYIYNIGVDLYNGFNGLRHRINWTYFTVLDGLAHPLYSIKNGYIMMQYSVYCKIFANREAAVKHVNILQRNVPQKGQIRILLVTEKQYAKIEIIVGGKSNQEQVVNSDAFIKL